MQEFSDLYKVAYDRGYEQGKKEAVQEEFLPDQYVLGQEEGYKIARRGYIVPEWE
jgi:hypothetical protein